MALIKRRGRSLYRLIVTVLCVAFILPPKVAQAGTMARPQALTTSEISLTSGWQLISLPLAPTNADPSTVFASINGSYRQVYTYAGCDAADPWKLYDPADPAVSDLTALGETEGFWLEMTTAATLQVTGEERTEATIPLCTGWNLIGYPFQRAQGVARALASINGKYTRIFSNDNADLLDPWAIFNQPSPGWANDLTVMEPGRGYWILVTEDVTLTMTPPPVSDDLIPPQVSVSAAPAMVDVGQPVLISVSASDNQGVASVSLTVNNGAVPLDGAKQALYTPQTAGLYTVVAEATDAAGNPGRATASFRARAGSDDGPPAVALTTPADGALITQTATLVGTATDSDLAFYELQLARGHSANHLTFAQGATPVTNGALGELDPTLYLPGLYAVRLCAEDTWGNRACSTPLDYEIHGRRPKPGFARLAFLDGMIDLAGLPLTARRIYDSRIKMQGDFGVGWQLDLTQITLQVSDVMGDNWQVVVQPGTIITYLLKPAAKHRVIISLPDGSLHRFQLRIEPRQQQLRPIDLLDGAFFDPLPGTVTQLTTTDQPALLDGATTGGSVQVLDNELQLYDPSNYTLRFPDGRRFTFVRTQGAAEFRLSQIVDANNNTITVTTNTITHSAGGSITFVRDAQERITEMRLNDGRTRRYTYDAAGDLVAAVDFAGHTTQFRYDDNHNLLQIIDPRGQIPGTLLYDEDGRITGMVDANGQRVEVIYDEQTNQEAVADRLGNTTINTYDEAGNLITTVDPLGHTTSYTYDELGRVTSSINPLGQVERYGYNSFGQLATYTNPLGHTWRKEYDTQGRLTKEIDPLGRTTSYEYDARGNVTGVVTPRGGRYTYTYTAQGLPQTVTDPLGGATSFVYDATGRLDRFTDPLGKTSNVTVRPDGLLTLDEYTVDGQTVRYEYTYDANGNLTNLKLPDGRLSSVQLENGIATAAINTGGAVQSLAYNTMANVTQFTNYDGGPVTFEYDAENRVTAQTAPGGARTEVTYDPLGRPAVTAIADGSVYTTTFDAAGRIERQVRAGLGEQHYQYDAAGRLTRETASDGATVAYGYDAATQLRVVTDTLGYNTRFAYDDDGNLTQVIYADNNTVQMEYNLVGQRTRLVDERGAEVRYGYNTGGQLISVTDPLGQVTNYDYHADLGLIEQVTTPSGQSWHFAYDQTGRQTSRTFPWGGVEGFVYDAVGRVERVVDATGVATRFAYDVMGRPLTRTLASGVVEAQSFDRASRLLHTTDATGRTNFAYDNRGRTRRIDYPDGEFVEYEYTPAGQLRRLRTQGGTTTYTYDTRGRVTSVADSVAGTTSYSYDTAGRVRTATLPDGSTTTYTYSPRGWLTGLRTLAADGVTVIDDLSYNHDAAGNPIAVVDGVTGRSVGYNFDPAGRVISETRSGPDAATLLYGYDADWNLTQKGNQTLSYDGAMRLTADGNWSSYTYDQAGRPLSRSNGNVSEQFTYDSLGRLIRVERNGALPAQVELTYNYANLLVRIAADGEVRRLVWDLSAEVPQLLEERSDDGNLIRRYVHGLGPIAVHDGAEVSLLHRDMLGSIRLVTDPAGAVRSRYAFAAYGDQTLGAGDETSLLRFAGQYYVPELGLYYMRARFYDPGAGRFFTPDLMPTDVEEPQSYNPYLYVGANPVRFVDPTGLISVATVTIGVAIANILISAVLSYLPSPVVWLAEAAGFDLRRLEMDMVGWSTAIAYNKAIFVGGFQFDVVSGPTKTMIYISLFAGGQAGSVYGDPRFDIKWSAWTGPILGKANSDPGKPRFLTTYITFGGTFARMLVKGFSPGSRNGYTTPNWSRYASAFQWELGGFNSDTMQSENGVYNSISIYGSFWGNVAPAEFRTKNKYIQNSLAGNYTGKKFLKRTAWDGGIALTIYFPLLWITWHGFDVDGYGPF